jgi:hypothetical protein
MDGSQPKLLFILADEHETKASAHLGALRRTMMTGSDLRELINPGAYKMLVVSRYNLREISQLSLAPFDMIANVVTEPVRHREILENVRKVLRTTRGRVLNPPDAVLGTTRERVARTLAGIDNLIAPATVRIAAGTPPAAAAQLLDSAGLRGPIILRHPGTHLGKSMALFDSIEAAADALEPQHEHIATQFVDFRSPDGLYRKYRVFFIGREIVLRHMLVSDHWNVHGADRKRFMAPRAEIVAQERALFETDDPFPQNVCQVLHDVRARMPLDYFGMDFAIREDGTVALFEANISMSFFPFAADPQFEHCQKAFEPAQNAFRELLGLPPTAALPRHLARTA